MSYRPVFDNDCFSTNSTLFIPAFKSLRKPTSSNSEATSHGLGSNGPDEREARKKLRARREQLRKLADDDDVIKHDKYHAANLLSRRNPATSDRDAIVTAAAHTRPPPPPSPSTHTQHLHPNEPSTDTSHHTHQLHLHPSSANESNRRNLPRQELRVTRRGSTSE